MLEVFWEDVLGKLFVLSALGSGTGHLRRSAGIHLGTQAYLQDHKAVAIRAPSDDRFVRGILEHPATSSVSISRHPRGGAGAAAAAGRDRTCIVCAPGHIHMSAAFEGLGRGSVTYKVAAGAVSSLRAARLAFGRHGVATLDCRKTASRGADRCSYTQWCIDKLRIEECFNSDAKGSRAVHSLKIGPPRVLLRHDPHKVKDECDGSLARAGAVPTFRRGRVS